MFEINQLDIIRVVNDPALLTTYEINLDIEVSSTPSLYFEAVLFDLEAPIFKDDPVKGKAIRKAIAHAINREYLVQVFRDGRSIISNSPITEGNTFYYNQDNPIVYDYNIETALDYMYQAGYDVYAGSTHSPLDTVIIDPDDSSDTDPSSSNVIYGLKLSSSLIAFSTIAVFNRRRKKL